MDEMFRPFDLHLMICTNTRGPSTDGKPVKQSCGPLGAEGIRLELKSWLKEQVMKRPRLQGVYKARVNSSGCLDFCSKGVALAIYPRGDFLLSLQNQSADLDALKSRILAILDEAETQAETESASKV